MPARALFSKKLCRSFARLAIGLASAGSGITWATWLAVAARLQEGLDTFRQVGDHWGIGRSFVDLGCLASEQEDYDAARTLFEQALNIFMELDYKRGIAKVLEGFACLAVREGDFDRALVLGGAAEGLRHKLGAPARPLERAMLDRCLQPAWHDRDALAVRSVWMKGWQMSLHEAIERTQDCHAGLPAPGEGSLY